MLHYYVACITDINIYFHRYIYFFVADKSSNASERQWCDSTFRLIIWSVMPKCSTRCVKNILLFSMISCHFIWVSISWLITHTVLCVSRLLLLTGRCGSNHQAIQRSPEQTSHLAKSAFSSNHHQHNNNTMMTIITIIINSVHQISTTVCNNLPQAPCCIITIFKQRKTYLDLYIPLISSDSVPIS